jgi:hypothetical protein
MPNECLGSEYDNFVEKENDAQVEHRRRQMPDEHDRMRALALAKEQELRSLSKTEKGSKSALKKPAATTTTLQLCIAAPPNLFNAALVLLSLFRLPPQPADPTTATTTFTSLTRTNCKQYKPWASA